MQTETSIIFNFFNLHGKSSQEEIILKMARASRARRKSLYEPTAASERAPRDRKAPEIFTFTSSQVTSKIKHPGGRKRKVGRVFYFHLITWSAYC